MKVQAEVSLYPLRTRKLSGPVKEFCRALRSRGLFVGTRSMSTFVAGESESLFNALREGFEGLARQMDVVVDVKISNACPDTTEQGREDTERVDCVWPAAWPKDNRIQNSKDK